MRTNIDIDEKLMKIAQRLSKVKTKKEIVHLALGAYIKDLHRKEMIRLEGKIKWEGDLDEMRRA